MAKLSCSYCLVLMLVLSGKFIFFPFPSIKKLEGKRCQKTIDEKMACDPVDCRLSCYSGFNGVGKCFDDRKVPGPSNCGCLYNC
ncbi:unnamed protein product [Cochlearia groenlandica]